MNYPLKNEDEIIDIWLSVFEALSIGFFKHDHREFGFPFPPPEDLRNLAKEFVLAYFLSQGHEVPETPQLLSPVNLNNKGEETLLWESTITHLQNLGYADAVYQWGRQTHDNYRGHSNRLFSFTSNWQSLLDDWALTPEKYPPPDLAETTLFKLQLILLRALASSQKFQIRWQHIEEKHPKPRWDTYAFKNLYVGYWLYNQASFVAHIARWQKIFELLSPTEVQILQAWGWQHFEKVNFKERVPLVPIILE